MGFVLSKMWGAIYASEKDFKIIIIGLNNAGKTTILYRL